MVILEKKIVLFSDDENLKDVVTSCLLDNTAVIYSYEEALLSDINFEGKIIILDIDTTKINTKSFVDNLVKYLKPENKLIVVGTNCERKNIIDFAKLGVDRFIVKPLGKKRFKNLILPYIDSICSNVSVSEEFNSDFLM